MEKGGFICCSWEAAKGRGGRQGFDERITRWWIRAAPAVPPDWDPNPLAFGFRIIHGCLLALYFLDIFR